VQPSLMPSTRKGTTSSPQFETPFMISQSLAKAPSVTVLTFDVLSFESIAAAVKSVSAETGGKLGVLVNISGTNTIFQKLDSPIEAGSSRKG
jgi:1-acylglycerone phosphate reductase